MSTRNCSKMATQEVTFTKILRYTRMLTVKGQTHHVLQKSLNSSQSMIKEYTLFTMCVSSWIILLLKCGSHQITAKQPELLWCIILKKIVLEILKLNERYQLTFNHGLWRAEQQAYLMVIHIYISEYPAYFVISSLHGNLFYFIRHFVSGLFGLLIETRRLGIPSGSKLFYRGYNPPLNDVSWHAFNTQLNKTYFQDILYALGVQKQFGMYFENKPNMCYQNAIFGWRPYKIYQLVQYLKRKLPFNESLCKEHSIIIVERSNNSYRHILNVQELKAEIIKAGYSNVKIVIFEYISFLEQYQIVRCARILIGLLHYSGICFCKEPGLTLSKMCK